MRGRDVLPFPTFSRETLQICPTLTAITTHRPLELAIFERFCNAIVGTIQKQSIKT